MALVAILTAAVTTSARARSTVDVRTSDVDLFYKIYDATGGAPGAAALQDSYIDTDSDGVRQFVPNRIVSGRVTWSRHPSLMMRTRLLPSCANH
ncbi:MAG: hypothetical protein KGM49_00925 [Sphingomonadales bacterium]|nr:hypothetical protein [Sphingomonadales bacterium]